MIKPCRALIVVSWPQSLPIVLALIFEFAMPSLADTAFCRLCCRAADRVWVLTTMVELDPDPTDCAEPSGAVPAALKASVTLLVVIEFDAGMLKVLPPLNSMP